MKYVLVTGGVLSGIGKGIIASSTGMILKAMGFRVTSIKIDPYLNIDAGTMSPFEHGEVFVLDDGGEVDLDLGNYERFLGVTLTRDNNITTGKIYNYVIEKERRGNYLGKTVQVVPHISDEIQAWIERVANVSVDGEEGAPDVCIIELGGTVGDIESMPFIEALRQFQFRVGTDNFCLLHVSLVPVIGVVGEQKTKPTQATVRELRALGLSPDIVVCRSQLPLTTDTKRKISSFCHVQPENVVSVHDVSNIYGVPLLLHHQGLPNLVLARLHLSRHHHHRSSLSSSSNLELIPTWLADWHQLSVNLDEMQKSTIAPIRIAMVGKYTGLSDSYLSVIKALEHASLEIKRRLVIDWVEATDLEDIPSDESQHHQQHHICEADRNPLAGSGYIDIEPSREEKREKAWKTLKEVHGILVPGGFGDRGVEGMILASSFARSSGKPYLGICLGMQVAVIEFARGVLGWKTANSEEFNKQADHSVVIFMPEISKTHMGATMRLGSRETIFRRHDSKLAKLYNVSPENNRIEERHRHRYEVNPEYVKNMEEKGLMFVGTDKEGVRMGVLELSSHDYFVGTQFHPEFKSRPRHPSPPFVGLLLACWRQEIKKNLNEGALGPMFEKWHMS
eukprot:TRINITY_DN2671_c0_g1_i4.p1 TRINITY_DN2671_c0_g1~~TRINITY_DN2671_c0_g1_i4.p1  ORF type:complete len:620 (+),score=172.55 TRINITY_DN2671_c0_g1_i4:1515-3374(+)